MTPVPILPQPGKPSVADIVPACLGPTRPGWLPPAVAGARSIVLFVLDGLGWNQLHRYAEHAPTISTMAGSRITTVCPSTTAAALTSISTGTHPGEHGLVGYRFDVHGEVLNALRWWTASGDARKRISPADVQRIPPFMASGVPVVTKAEFNDTGFTLAHLRGARLTGWRVPSTLVVRTVQLVLAGEPFVYVYYDGIDKVAHEFGLADEYLAEVAFADRLVADLLARLPDDVALVVTADHGQVDVGNRIVKPSAELMRRVRHLSGEARFRWFHARSGMAADLEAACRTEFADTCWVRTVDEICAEGWLGPHVTPVARGRLGDVAVIPFAAIGIDDPADSGLYELIARHGSATDEEMYVPLVARRGARLPDEP